MRKWKTAGRWYIILNKRFLKKYIFTLLLCLVPLLVLGLRAVSSGDSGVLHILLYCENAEDPLSRRTADELLNLNGIVLYEEVYDAEKAQEEVLTGGADSLWVFPDAMEHEVAAWIEGGRESTPITVYLREDTVQTRMVREQLFGVLYPTLSEALTENFLNSEESLASADASELQDYIDAFYEGNRVAESIFQFSYLDGTVSSEETGNYLTTPLRGLLALLVLICGLAAAMFFMQDQEEQLFAAMPIRHRGLFPLLYQLTAVGDGALAAFAALALTGTFTVWYRELLLLLIYCLAVAGACNLLRLLTRRITVFGAAIPVLVLVTLVLCPIFISTRRFPMIQYLLPTFYYLNALHSNAMLFRMLLYAAVTWGAGIVMEKISERKVK